MKITLKLAVFLIMISYTNLYSQLVFEKTIYPSSNYGDVVNQDIIVSRLNNSDDLINTGYYNYNQGDSTSTFHATLSDHNSSSTQQFAYHYVATDTDSNKLDTKGYSVAEYNGGYIVVGTVFDNSYHGSSVTGGGDLLILKCNSSGSVLAHKIIDMGGNEIGYAIKQMRTASNFVLCGESTYSDGSGTGFVMKIDNNLNIVWKTELDFRISAGTKTINPFNDIIFDGTDIWAVGEVKNTSSIQSFGLVVKLNSSGVYQLSRRLYNSTDRIKLNHVELETHSQLIITGTHNTGSGKSKPNRMMALKYSRISNTVGVDLRLGADKNIGYDIIKTSFGGTVNYYVVGERTPSSGSKTGILYILNSSFQAIKEVKYSGIGNTGLYAIDSTAYDTNGTTNFMAMGGYYGRGGTYSEGYLIKAGVDGYSGCNDTVAVDTAYQSLSTTTLIDSVDTNYSTFTNIIYRDSLVDTLICMDTATVLGLRIGMNTLIETEDFNLASNIYPNPIKKGEVLKISFENGLLPQQVKIINGLGQVVMDKNNISSPYLQLETSDLSRGIYITQITYKGNINSEIKFYKFIIQ